MASTKFEEYKGRPLYVRLKNADEVFGFKEDTVYKDTYTPYYVPLRKKLRSYFGRAAIENHYHYRKEYSLWVYDGRHWGNTYSSLCDFHLNERDLLHRNTPPLNQ